MDANQQLDKLGTGGLFLTAALSPCCFPIFAFIGSIFGLGSAELLGPATMWVFQALVVVTLLGLFLSYRSHRCLYPLLLGVPGSMLIFYGYHFHDFENWIYFLYAGMFLLMGSTLWNYQRNKLHGTSGSCSGYSELKAELTSMLTCPECGHQKSETMPTDSCSYYYECENCHSVLKPLEGDCCVYCSYGTVKCPPIQAGTSCC